MILRMERGRYPTTYRSHIVIISDRPWERGAVYLLRTFRIGRLVPNFSREPPFLLRGPSYMREYQLERADSPRSELAASMVAALINPKIAI
jgi:hypothetical protein